MSVTDPDEEQAMIAAARAGDARAFQMLVQRYEQQVYRAAYFILRDSDEAEEVAQEASCGAIKLSGSSSRANRSVPGSSESLSTKR